MSVKELNPATAALAVLLADKFNYDKKENTINRADDTFTGTLPEDLTPAIVERVSEHYTTFAAASAKVYGDLAIKALTADEKLDRVSIEIPLTGKDSLSFSMDRSVTSPIPGKPGESVTKYGVLRPKFDFVAGNNSGQLKLARTQLNELAEAALCK
jgi:hypothetical protein